MQEIADRAGINKALLHYYFRSKDKLFDAVFDEAINDLFPQLSSKFNDHDSVENVLKNVVVFYHQYLKANPFLPQFIFHEIWQHPEKLARFISEQDQMIERVTTISKSLKSQGNSKYMPQHFIANVLGLCIFPFLSRPILQRVFFENNEQNYNEFIDERTEMILNMLHNFIKTDKTSIQ